MSVSLNFHELTISLPLGKRKASKKQVLSKKFLAGISLFLIVLSIGAWVFYYSQDLTLSYNDARSHLNVARRVFDNLQPGLAQIGSVWLPLYHVLELPFVWNNFLWQSGLAGSIVSMASFVLGGFYIVKLAQKLNFDLGATMVAVAIYAINPNLLFMQTTPMTESLLMFLSIAAVYYTVSWVKSLNILDIMAAGFFTFLATLTRYDGWFLLIFIAMAVSYVAFKKRGIKFVEGNVILFATLAGFGVFLWILWNWVIFGDPLYFVFGPFSAKVQQDVLLAQGRLFTKGNPVYSFFLYLLVARYNVGVWLGLLSLIGGWLFIKSKEYSREVKIAVGLLLVPFIFNVFSLVAGHSVIHLPNLPPYTWFNDRYGLMMLPAVAIAVGFLVKGKRAALILVSLILLTQTYLTYVSNQIITIEDGVKGASGDFLDEAGNWIGANIDDGLVLVAASSNDALLFRSGLNLNQFIVEGARGYWEDSLEDPTRYAKWVIMRDGDLVEKELSDNPNFLDNYRLVYRDEFSYIYKLDKASNRSLSENELP